MMEALVGLWIERQETFVLTVEHMEVLVHYRLDEMATWRTALGEVGSLFYTAVVLPMAETGRHGRSMAATRTYRVVDLRQLIDA